MSSKRSNLFFIAGAAMLAGACDVDDDNLRLVGQLESDRIEITTQVFEPITERPVIEGQAVRQGDVIVRQNAARANARNAEAEAALQQSRARHDELVRGPRRELILAAQANVRGAQNELEFRETDLTRAQQVFDRKLASPEVRDRAVVARDTARANLESAAARLEELLSGTTVEELQQAEEAVKQAEARLQLALIETQRHTSTAPGDGIVDSLLFEVGEQPAVGQPLAILLSGEQPYARVYIPESLRVGVSAGTAASIYVDGLDEPVAGRVRWVATESTFTPYFALTERDRSRLSYVAKIDVLNVNDRLPDGVPVEVELLTGVTGE